MKSQSVVYRYRTDFNRYYLFTLKTSTGTAWKNQPVGRDRKPDFFCCNGAIIFSGERYESCKTERQAADLSYRN